MVEEKDFDEIVQLLVAAGYFRARIKGLSPFDKIVGGMAWALEMCSEDIDVDLLFQESLSIGQKIALTEKIVAVLQKMKCPHRLEPNQLSVQDVMDYSNIFPVIQWLVKKSFEYRQMVAGYIKNYAVGQFNKRHFLAQDAEALTIRSRIKSSIRELDLTNRPKRKFRHPAKHTITEEKANVKTTLLEYGRLPGDYQLGLGAAGSEGRGAGDGSGSGADTNSAVADNEAKMEQLFSDSDHERNQKGRRVSVSVVGSIVGSAAEQIAALAEEYNRKQLELAETTLEGRERLLRKQLEEVKHQLTTTREDGLKQKATKDNLRQEIAAIQTAQEDVDTKALNESEEDKAKRAKLLSEIDANKKKRSEFRTNCRTHKAAYETEIEQLAEKERGSTSSTAESEDDAETVSAELATAREKLAKVKLQLAKRNKAVSALQRKLDDVPGRAELTQYQKRFVELYDQVAAKHMETKKFYILYNQCDDTRIQLEMELKLLSTVLDNFNIANSTPSARESFLSQFEQIVQNIQIAKQRVENKRMTEKAKRDALNQQNLMASEKQRLYYKCLKEFTDECRKNEILVDKLKIGSKSNTPNHSQDAGDGEQ